MSLERDVQVWVTQQERAGDLAVASPLLVPGVTWPGARPDAVGTGLVDYHQSQLWQGGRVLDVVAALPELTLHAVETLPITLPEVRGIKGARPAIELELPVVIARAHGGFLAVAASLAASWPGETPEAALDGLRARVILALLSREEPLEGAALVELLATRRVTVESVAGKVVFPTASEVREHAKARAKLVDVVAPRMEGVQAWALEPEVEALRRALDAGRSVVIVGPNGVGKTALVGEIARVHKQICVRSVTAPQLLMRLLTDGGWQDPLVRLARELAESGDRLYVGRLTELFEVGRYEGNPTSMGEYLAPSVQRGDVRLLAEATPEELARLDARYPGLLDGLVRIPFPEPTARLETIVMAWADAKGPILGVRFQRDAVREILRLQRRFAPYSGFPGRSIRFLEGLAHAHVGPVVDMGRDDVIARYCAESGLPRPLVDSRSPLPAGRVRAHFEGRIFGQPEAVDAVCDALATVTADVARAGKPLVSMLFVGPTGVGKTEMARALAAFLFGSADRMIRFDMSEYASPAAVLRLVEGPGGDGQLTGAVRRQPFAVILLDELEKAHPAVLDLLLQVLGEGRLTDGKGVVADFCSAVILMTSNVGSAEAKRESAGFGRDSAVRTQPYQDAVRAWLRPELLNRIDRVLAFSPLGPAAVQRVLDRELIAFASRPGLRGRGFEVSPKARARLLEAGYAPAWGARQLLRAVHDQLAAPVATALDGWKDASPADVRVGDDLRVELTRGVKRTRLTTMDELHAEAQVYRRNLGAVLDGGVYAELDAKVQRRKDKESAETLAMREMLAGLRTLARDALTLEMDVGAAALADEALSDAATRLASLRTATHRATQALLGRVRPELGIRVLALYGLEESSLGRVLALYRALAAEWRIELEVGTLHSGPNAFVLALPGDPPPKAPLGPRVGYELLLKGAGAGLLFADEIGLHRFVSGAKDGLVHVLLHAGTRATWAPLRPADLHRKHFFAGPPRRVVRDDVEDREDGWTLESWDRLPRHLSVRFAARVIEELR